MKAALAVRNLRRSGGRLWVSLFGIAFAILLMAVQGSLLHSFTRAASQIVDAVDADLWIVGKGTPTFDYVSPIPERYAFLALGVDGVRDAGRGIAGWAPIQRPNGDKTLVMLIGVENGYRGALPAVADLAGAKGLSLAPQMGRRQLLTSDPADKSDRDVMEVIIDLESKQEYLPIGLRVSVIFLE